MLRPYSRAQPDNSLDFIGAVGLRGDDKKTGKEVRRNTVGRANVVGASDDSVSTVGGKDNNRGDGGLEGPVQVSEAFNVEHVDLGYIH